MVMGAKGLMVTSRFHRWGAFFLRFLFALLEILDGIFACPYGGRYRADDEQQHDNDAPNPLSAILLHQPQKEGDEGYRENQDKKPATPCHAAKVGRKPTACKCICSARKGILKHFGKLLQLPAIFIIF